MLPSKVLIQKVLVIGILQSLGCICLASEFSIRSKPPKFGSLNQLTENGGSCEMSEGHSEADSCGSLEGEMAYLGSLMSGMKEEQCQSGLLANEAEDTNISKGASDQVAVSRVPLNFMAKGQPSIMPLLGGPPASQPQMPLSDEDIDFIRSKIDFLRRRTNQKQSLQTTANPMEEYYKNWVTCLNKTNLSESHSNSVNWTQLDPNYFKRLLNPEQNFASTVSEIRCEPHCETKKKHNAVEDDIIGDFTASGYYSSNNPSKKIPFEETSFLTRTLGFVFPKQSVRNLTDELTKSYHNLASKKFINANRCQRVQFISDLSNKESNNVSDILIKILGNATNKGLTTNKGLKIHQDNEGESVKSSTITEVSLKVNTLSLPSTDDGVSSNFVTEVTTSADVLELTDHPDMGSTNKSVSTENQGSLGVSYSETTICSKNRGKESPSNVKASKNSSLNRLSAVTTKNSFPEKFPHSLNFFQAMKAPSYAQRYFSQPLASLKSFASKVGINEETRYNDGTNRTISQDVRESRTVTNKIDTSNLSLTTLMPEKLESNILSFQPNKANSFIQQGNNRSCGENKLPDYNWVGHKPNSSESLLRSYYLNHGNSLLWDDFKTSRNTKRNKAIEFPCKGDLDSSSGTQMPTLEQSSHPYMNAVRMKDKLDNIEKMFQMIGGIPNVDLNSRAQLGLMNSPGWNQQLNFLSELLTQYLIQKAFANIPQDINSNQMAPECILKESSYAKSGVKEIINQGDSPKNSSSVVSLTKKVRNGNFSSLNRNHSGYIAHCECKSNHQPEIAKVNSSEASNRKLNLTSFAAKPKERLSREKSSKVKIDDKSKELKSIKQSLSEQCLEGAPSLNSDDVKTKPVVQDKPEVVGYTTTEDIRVVGVSPWTLVFSMVTPAPGVSRLNITFSSKESQVNGDNKNISLTSKFLKGADKFRPYVLDNPAGYPFGHNTTAQGRKLYPSDPFSRVFPHRSPYNKTNAIVSRHGHLSKYHMQFLNRLVSGLNSPSNSSREYRDELRPSKPRDTSVQRPMAESEQETYNEGIFILQPSLEPDTPPMNSEASILDGLIGSKKDDKIRFHQPCKKPTLLYIPTMQVYI